MIVVPDRYTLTGDLKIEKTSHGFVWLDCIIDQPPSQQGRAVKLRLDQQAVTDLIKFLRKAAIEDRR